MRGKLRIEEIYAFVVVDKDGTEGIIGHIDPFTGSSRPMIGADQARIESLLPEAQLLADQFGVSVSLLRFSTRSVDRVLTPSKKKGGPAN